MRYKVILEESDEGFAVSVPGLPGCHLRALPSKRRSTTFPTQSASISMPPRNWPGAGVADDLTSPVHGAFRAAVLGPSFMTGGSDQ